MNESMKMERENFLNAGAYVRKGRWPSLWGERLVGETLNQLSGDTTYVFHDIPGERFNVDHIIVSTRGVYVIETKHFDRNLCHEFFFDGSMVYRLLKNGKRFPCPKLLPQINGEALFWSALLFIMMVNWMIIGYSMKKLSWSSSKLRKKFTTRLSSIQSRIRFAKWWRLTWMAKFCWICR